MDFSAFTRRNLCIYAYASRFSFTKQLFKQLCDIFYYLLKQVYEVDVEKSIVVEEDVKEKKHKK